ncbi:Syntaxin-8 [Stylosanthes scabra]|uniref:peroxidase n=1 Tax=Stylosanthes scabra TaxID=79078 RepID=A0ABU6TBQ2_9FABA|nr:Syntaxin-8 [Stylosanthes scabra]
MVFGDLRFGFYSFSCPNAEAIVRDVVLRRFNNDKSITAALLRMHFHDCFVTGCDASLLIDPNPARNKTSEKNAGPKITVRGFDIIDEAKSALEQACPSTVSCADIISLATRDAVALAGGPTFNVPTGRRDGLVSDPALVKLPGPSLSVLEVLKFFTAKGFSLFEMVALMAAGHSVGNAHCSNFRDRLSSFNNGTVDPTMDPNLDAKLVQVCGSSRQPATDDPRVFLDITTPLAIDTQFLNQILLKRGILHIDQQLALDPLSSDMVSRFARDSDTLFQTFAKAMIKLSTVNVLVGDQGEIRRNYLKLGFYSSSCPNAEAMVRDVVQRHFNQDRSITAALLRMHFHDCFVRGCDASLLIDSTENESSEKDAGPNQTVRGFEIIDEAKTLLEESCPSTVSCADIISLATRDAVAMAGGPAYNVSTGRRDGLFSNPKEVKLPSPTMSVSEALEFFTAKGFSLFEMVTLLGGGHSVGNAHCSNFQERLSSFNRGSPDPTMDPDLDTRLVKVCGSSSRPARNDPTVFLDEKTPFAFDNRFYNEILDKRGILHIDQQLAMDSLSRDMVSRFADDGDSLFQNFANAMIKLSAVNVWLGNEGEIRKNCRAFNKNNNE